MKTKTWPDFAEWSQGLWQSTEEKKPSKPLEPALYLVATPIGNLGDITLRALWTLAHVDTILCEDTRVTGQMLHRYQLKKPFLPCHDHNEEKLSAEIVQRIKKGESFALVSDAGTPLVSDPGFRLTRLCRSESLPVYALPGASALLTALGSAGLPTDQFFFAGFLSSKQTARRKELEAVSNIPGSLVFYESPQRIAKSLEDMALVLSDDRQAVVARELTKLYEEQRSGTLKELASYYKEAPTPKGEFVVVLGPKAQEVVSEDTIDRALKEAMETQSTKDAAAFVAEALGLKKKALYQRALTIKTNLSKD